MFIKNRKGIEILQVIVIGLALVALGLIFLSQLNTGNAAQSFNNATGTMSNQLNNAVNNLGQGH